MTPQKKHLILKIKPLLLKIQVGRRAELVEFTHVPCTVEIYDGKFLVTYIDFPLYENVAFFFYDTERDVNQVVSEIKELTEIEFVRLPQLDAYISEGKRAILLNGELDHDARLIALLKGSITKDVSIYNMLPDLDYLEDSENDLHLIAQLFPYYKRREEQDVTLTSLLFQTYGQLIKEIS